MKIIFTEVNKHTKLKSFSIEKCYSIGGDEENNVYDTPYKICLPNVETLHLKIGFYDIGQLLHDNPKLKSLTMDGTKVINSKEYYSTINQNDFFKCISIDNSLDSIIDESFEPLINFILKCSKIEMINQKADINIFKFTNFLK